MTESQRVSLGQTLAGKNQYKVLASVMANFNHATEAMETAVNSAGSAVAENEAYMQSWEATVNGLKAAWQNLSTSIIQGDFIKGLVNAGTAITNFVAQSDLLKGTLKTLLITGVLFGASQLFTINKILPMIINQFRNFGALMVTATTAGADFAAELAIIGGEGGALAGVFNSILPAILAVVAGLAILGGTLNNIINEAEASYTTLEKAQAQHNRTTGEISKTYSESIKQIEQTKKEGLEYVDYLDTLQKKMEDGVDVQDEYNRVLGKLENLFGELPKSIGDTTDGLRAFIEEWSQSGELSADQIKLNSQIEDYNNLIQAQVAQNSELLDLELQRGMVEAKLGELQSKVTSGASFKDIFSALNEMDRASAALESYDGQISSTQEAIEDSSDSTNEYREEITELAKELGITLKIADDGIITIDKVKSGITDTTELTEDQLEALLKASASLKSYTEALHDASNELDSAYQAIQKLQEAASEKYGAGEYGSSAISTFIDTVLSPEKQAELEYNVDNMMGYINSLNQALFSSDSKTAAIAFQDTITSIIQAKDELGTFDPTTGAFSVSSWSKLAEEMGISESYVQALRLAWQQYSGQMLISGEEIEALTTQMGQSEIVLRGTQSDLVDTLSQLQEATGALTGTELSQWVNALQSAGVLKIDADTTEVNEAISTVITNAKELVEEPADVTITADDQATSVMQGIEDFKFSEKTVTIKADNQTGINLGGTFANGTEEAKGGLSLVNDGDKVNGTAKELIVDNGQAYIADSEPALVNLHKGAKVFTAKETQDILGNKKNVKQIQAFAEGSTITGSLVNLIPTGGGGGGSSSGSGSSRLSDEASKEKFEKLRKEKEHQLKMDEITEEEYYEWLEEAYKKYLGNRKSLQEEYWKYEEQIYEWRKKGLEDAIELEEKLNDLAKAKTQRVLVLKDGMFQYVENIEAIHQAQSNLAGYTGATALNEDEGVIRQATVMPNQPNVKNYTGDVTTSSSGDTFNIGKVQLENVNDVEELFNGLKNLAIQNSVK